MSFGKLFTVLGNPRSTAILAVAKANGLDLDVIEVDTKNPTSDFLAVNKLAKVPTFVGADGYHLSEAIAIAIYVTSQNEKTALLGKTKQDYASILKWMSFFNSEVLPPLGAWYRPLLGRDPYNKRAVDEASKTSMKAISVIEDHLLQNTYLVGERISLADVFAVGIISRGFEFFFGKSWRNENPNVSRWYETMYSQAIYLAVAPPLSLLDAPILTNTPPHKAEAASKKKAMAAKDSAAAPGVAQEEPTAPEPKPKHPLDLLPRASLPLDEWKKFYSNNETPIAMKWFWERFDFEEYSLWKVTYKYNNELTQIFMSSNLVGGFNNRLEASRKYLFGCGCVFGTDNNSVIQGAFVVRGQEFLPVFDVAPDHESYSFTKLNPRETKDRELVELLWSWDRPINVDGKNYDFASGKVFK